MKKTNYLMMEMKPSAVFLSAMSASYINGIIAGNFTVIHRRRIEYIPDEEGKKEYLYRFYPEIMVDNLTFEQGKLSRGFGTFLCLSVYNYFTWPVNCLKTLTIEGE
jgi:hypothetical protein